MKKVLCGRCNKAFQDNRTAEQRLLDAIFGEHRICTECLRCLRGEVCCKCCKTGSNLIGLNGKMYHPECLPYEIN